MRKLLIFISVVISVAAGDFYIPVVGNSHHFMTSTHKVCYENSDGSEIVRNEKFNQTHNPYGLIYEDEKWGFGVLKYFNSWKRESEAVFGIYIKNCDGVKLKVSFGGVTGYQYEPKDKQMSLMLVPSVSKDFGIVSLDGGLLGAALFVNVRIKLTNIF